MEKHKELRKNITFLVRIRLFSSQVRDWVTKIAHRDFDAMAEMVSELDE